MSLSQSYTEPPRNAQPPNELRELFKLRQWVSFVVIPDPNGGKDEKRAYTPGTTKFAKSTTPETWGAFETAWRDVQAGRAHYVGFVPTPDDPYAISDYDDCLDPVTGKFTNSRAEQEILSCPGYVERSQSGTGVHAIVRGVRPGRRKRTGDFECYDEGQMILFTFDVLDGRNTIRNGQAWLTEVYHGYFPPQEPKAEPAPPRAAPIIHLEDRDVIDRLRRQKDGRGARVLDGDLSGHDSPSEARAYLVAKLYTCEATVEQTARILQQHPVWKEGETEQEKDRKAGIDAERGFEWCRQQGVKKYSDFMRPPAADYENVDTETGEILDDADSTDVVDSEEVERWKARAIKAERDRSQLIALMLNPHIKHAEKLALVRTGQLVLKKQPDGEGRVGIKAAEIANDWRAKPEPGENTAITNADGSVPLMSRGSVNGVMKRLTGDKELGCKKVARLIDAEGVAQKVTPKNGTQPWAETVWYVPRPASLGDFLAEAATFSAERKRKLRTITPPCPECGEIHPRTVKTTTEYQCHGCGGSWSEEGAERVEWPIVQIGPDETGPMPVEEYERQQAERRASAPQHAQQSPLPPTEDPEPPDPEPDEAAPHAGGLKFTGTHSRTCRDCFAELEEGQFTLCRSCSAEYKRKRDQADRVRRAGTHPCTECGEPTATLGTRHCPAHGGASAEVAS